MQCEVAANPAPNVDWLRNGDPVSIFTISTFTRIHVSSESNWNFKKIRILILDQIWWPLRDQIDWTAN